MADGEAEGDVVASVFFLVVSFLVVVADSFLVASVDVFLVVDLVVMDFFVVEVLAGGVVVVDVSVLLVVQEAMRPAASITVME